MKKLLKWLKGWMFVGDVPLVYRRVIKRQLDDGEVVHLECGHSFRIVLHERALFPCADCRAAHERERR